MSEKCESSASGRSTPDPADAAFEAGDMVGCLADLECEASDVATPEPTPRPADAAFEAGDMVSWLASLEVGG